MKAYVGAKIIMAEPMDKQAWKKESGQPFTGEENMAGYKVIYPDGYTSWSPKKTFEDAYRFVTSGEVSIICGAAGVFHSDR